MGDRLGTPNVVGFLFWNCSLLLLCQYVVPSICFFFVSFLRNFGGEYILFKKQNKSEASVVGIIVGTRLVDAFKDEFECIMNTYPNFSKCIALLKVSKIHQVYIQRSVWYVIWLNMHYLCDIKFNFSIFYNVIYFLHNMILRLDTQFGHNNL